MRKASRSEWFFSTLFRRFRQLDPSRYIGWLALLFVISFVIPTLGDGFSTDDYFMLQALERTNPLSPAWYDLYGFIPRLSPESIASGVSPWWSSPDLKMHLLRPLSSALLALDHLLFGSWAFGYRVHSLLWLTLLLVFVRRLYLRVFDRAMGTLAFCFFALSPCLVLPTLWISARHLLVAGAVVACGLIHLIESPNRPTQRWIACVIFVVALAASEAGLAGLAFWVAYEGFTRPNEPYVFRLRRLCLPVFIGASYLLIYSSLGAGTKDCGLYVDPIKDPQGFISVAVQRIPALLGDAFLHVDAGFVMIWPAPSISVGLVATALVVAVSLQTMHTFKACERLGLSWLVPGAFLATLGLAGGPPGSRSLTVAVIGFVPLIAILVRRGFTYFRTHVGMSRYVSFAIVAILGFTQCVYGPLVAVAFGSGFRQIEPKALAVERETAVATANAKKVVLLTGSDFTVWYHAFGRLRPKTVAQGCWWVLSAARGNHRMVRTSARNFSIELTDTEFRQAPFEKMWSSDRYVIPVGYEVSQCDAKIRVAALRNGNPYRLDVELDTSLDDPTLALLTWQNGKIRRVMPHELERGLEVQWSAGPMRIF
jgi:hypothetical protein